MNDLPLNEIMFNIQHLMQSKQSNVIPPEPKESLVDEFEFTSNPFAHMLSGTLLKVSGHDLTFGMELEEDVLFNHAYVHEIKDSSSTYQLFLTIKATCKKFRVRTSSALMANTFSHRLIHSGSSNNYMTSKPGNFKPNLPQLQSPCQARYL